MSKYKARKITRDGMQFDSLKEYRRFCQLVELEKAGKITDLRRQEKFYLIPSQYEQQPDGKMKCVERPCGYVADFVYKENGELVVEDVKGYRESTAYALFAVKRKLMLQVYGIRVREI